jgi:drug/metabolite transporter (DMT)-like permease
MARLLFVLLIGLSLEATGVVLLSKGLREIGEPEKLTLTEIARLLGRGVTNQKLLAGVALEAGFFGCLLYLMARADVSFIWPLTALSFVATTLLAKFFLNEEVTGLRWMGVVLILVGAGIITYSEKAKFKPQRPLISDRNPAARGH